MERKMRPETGKFHGLILFCPRCLMRKRTAKRGKKITYKVGTMMVKVNLGPMEIGTLSLMTWVCGPTRMPVTTPTTGEWKCFSTSLSIGFSGLRVSFTKVKTLHGLLFPIVPALVPVGHCFYLNQISSGFPQKSLPRRAAEREIQQFQERMFT